MLWLFRGRRWYCIQLRDERNWLSMVPPIRFLSAKCFATQSSSSSEINENFAALLFKALVTNAFHFITLTLGVKDSPWGNSLCWQKPLSETWRNFFERLIEAEDNWGKVLERSNFLFFWHDLVFILQRELPTLLVAHLLGKCSKRWPSQDSNESNSQRQSFCSPLTELG